MKEMSQKIMLMVLAGSILLGTTGQAIAGDLLTLPTQDGLEFYVVEGLDKTTAPNLELHNGTGWMLTPEGKIIKRDSLEARLLLTNVSKTENTPVFFPGLRTSLLGRVLGIGNQATVTPKLAIEKTVRSNTIGSVTSRLSIPPNPNQLALWEGAEGFQVLAF